MAAVANAVETLQQLHGQVSHWDAEQDELLLEALMGLKNDMLRRARLSEQRISDASRRVQDLSVRFRTAISGLEILSQYQFVEHRIDDDSDIEGGPGGAFEDEHRVSDSEGEVAMNDLQALQRSLDIGRRYVEEPPCEPAWGVLPPVIGSSEFWDITQGRSATRTSTAENDIESNAISEPGSFRERPGNDFFEPAADEDQEPAAAGPLSPARVTSSAASAAESLGSLFDESSREGASRRAPPQPVAKGMAKNAPPMKARPATSASLFGDGDGAGGSDEDAIPTAQLPDSRRQPPPANSLFDDDAPNVLEGQSQGPLKSSSARVSQVSAPKQLGALLAKPPGPPLPAAFGGEGESSDGAVAPLGAGPLAGAKAASSAVSARSTGGLFEEDDGDRLFGEKTKAVVKSAARPSPSASSSLFDDAPSQAVLPKAAPSRQAQKQSLFDDDAPQAAGGSNAVKTSSLFGDGDDNVPSPARSQPAAQSAPANLFGDDDKPPFAEPQLSAAPPAKASSRSSLFSSKAGLFDDDDGPLPAAPVSTTKAVPAKAAPASSLFDDKKASVTAPLGGPLLAPKAEQARASNEAPKAEQARDGNQASPLVGPLSTPSAPARAGGPESAPQAHSEQPTGTSGEGKATPLSGPLQSTASVSQPKERASLFGNDRSLFGGSAKTSAMASLFDDPPIKSSAMSALFDDPPAVAATTASAASLAPTPAAAPSMAASPAATAATAPPAAPAEVPASAPVVAQIAAPAAPPAPAPAQDEVSALPAAALAPAPAPVIAALPAPSAAPAAAPTRRLATLFGDDDMAPQQVLFGAKQPAAARARNALFGDEADSSQGGSQPTTASVAAGAASNSAQNVERRVSFTSTPPEVRHVSLFKDSGRASVFDDDSKHDLFGSVVGGARGKSSLDSLLESSKAVPSSPAVAPAPPPRTADPTPEAAVPDQPLAAAADPPLQVVESGGGTLDSLLERPNVSPTRLEALAAAPDPLPATAAPLLVTATSEPPMVVTPDPPSQTAEQAGSTVTPAPEAASPALIAPLAGTIQGRLAAMRQDSESEDESDDGGWGAPAAAPAKSLFGQSSSTSAVGGLFGQPPATTSTGNLFGQLPPAPSGGLFGQSTAASSSGSLFGQPPERKSAGGLFGQPQATSSAGDLFGQKASAAVEEPPAAAAMEGTSSSSPVPTVFQEQQPAENSIEGLPEESPVVCSAESPSEQLSAIEEPPAPNPARNIFEQPATTSSAGGLFGPSSGTSSSRSLFGQQSPPGSAGGLFGEPAPVIGREAAGVAADVSSSAAAAPTAPSKSSTAILFSESEVKYTVSMDKTGASPLFARSEAPASKEISTDCGPGTDAQPADESFTSPPAAASSGQPMASLEGNEDAASAAATSDALPLAATPVPPAPQLSSPSEQPWSAPSEVVTAAARGDEERPSLFKGTGSFLSAPPPPRYWSKGKDDLFGGDDDEDSFAPAEPQRKGSLAALLDSPKAESRAPRTPPAPTAMPAVHSSSTGLQASGAASVAATDVARKSTVTAFDPLRSSQSQALQSPRPSVAAPLVNPLQAIATLSGAAGSVANPLQEAAPVVSEPSAASKPKAPVDPLLGLLAQSKRSA